jgi:hypothetical protein
MIKPITNPNTMNRTIFLQRTIVGAASALLPISAFGQQTPQKPEPLDRALVKEFVGVAHGNFDRMRELLENEPQLLHVSNDWGGGDYESAIEAAGHVGNKEIAGYLMSKGARYNIYLACMLGHLPVVKQVLEFKPELLHSKGPHGFTMLHHAKKGGEEALAMEEYLTSLGATVTKLDFYAKA